MAIDFRILLILMEVYPLYIFILSATRERAEVIPEELRFTPATVSRYMGILLSNHFCDGGEEGREGILPAEQ